MPKALPHFDHQNLRPPLSLANAGLAAFVVLMVGLMVVPLPTWLLDILIAANLAAAVAILLVTLYVGNALRIAAFPTLLLITTLFRLSLNVSSTRLILLQADAGSVIRAFGDFVVQGNYVVGAVVFLVLTIIQWVVIAKGSERVAEVGARFVLDAMPGKQMAIDADVRNGAVDAEQARALRRELNRESQFYGAMDGAMKFVKGDVIASVLITLINITGGLVIGMGQRDMDAVSALKRYGLLTIGDGLSSQIPALLIATAAGVLVTRVASEESDTPLGEELGRQLLSVPGALFCASLFVTALALVPGLPWWPFLVIGGSLFFTARYFANSPAASPDASRLSLLRSPAGRLPEHGAADAAPLLPASYGRKPLLPMVTPWSVAVGPDLAHWVQTAGRGAKERSPRLRDVTEAVRETLFRALGVPLPEPCLSVVPSLTGRQLLLCVHELPEKAILPEPSLPDTELPGFFQAQLLQTLKPRAAEFLGISETQHLLDELERVAPATVRQVTPKPVSVSTLAEVLRRLVEEQISVRDLKGILEALSEDDSEKAEPLALAERARAGLRRPITHSVTGGSGELNAYLLDSSLEDTLRGAISKTSSGSFLALSPGAGRDILGALRAALSQGTHDEPPVLLTQADIRRFVRKLSEAEFPAIRVLSYAELLPETRITERATVSLRGVGL